MLAGDHDPVADLHRPFDQKDDPGDKIVDDILKAEADADRQGAGDNGDIRQVQSSCADRCQRGQREADIADAGHQRRLRPGVHPRLGQDRAAQDRLNAARDDDSDDEDGHKKQQIDRRKGEVADLKTLGERPIIARQIVLRHTPDQGDRRKRGQGQKRSEQNRRERKIGRPFAIRGFGSGRLRQS